MSINCNFYSPLDTYAVTKEENSYFLNFTSLLGESLSYGISIVDYNNIVVAETNLERLE